ncbi:hypothetical protein [Methanolobus sp. ZRKC5]|uniref:hypothetical protein n=1 Tax=Methanolobus sp. ZRKC5 TaxID=3136295 RepID=UPI00313CCD7A
MHPKKAAFLNIGISIIFVIAIIISDHIFEGTQHEQMALYLLIALWWIPFSLISVAGTKGVK